MIRDGLERMNLAIGPDAPGGDQGVLADVRSGVDHTHAGLEEPVEEIRLDRLVCSDEVNLALNVLVKVTEHLTAVEKPTGDRPGGKVFTPPFHGRTERARRETGACPGAEHQPGKRSKGDGPDLVHGVLLRTPSFVMGGTAMILSREFLRENRLGQEDCKVFRVGESSPRFEPAQISRISRTPRRAAHDYLSGGRACFPARPPLRCGKSLVLREDRAPAEPRRCDSAGALSPRGMLARKPPATRPVLGKKPTGAAEKVRAENGFPSK